MWQALVVLHLWIEKNRELATGNELERALKRIEREDIINRCMHNLEEVTDEHEKLQAMACLGSEMQPEVKEELEPKLEKDGNESIVDYSLWAHSCVSSIIILDFVNFVPMSKKVESPSVIEIKFCNLDVAYS